MYVYTHNYFWCHYHFLQAAGGSGSEVSGGPSQRVGVSEEGKMVEGSCHPPGGPTVGSRLVLLTAEQTPICRSCIPLDGDGPGAHLSPGLSGFVLSPCHLASRATWGKHRRTFGEFGSLHCELSGVGVVVSDAPQMHGGHLASSPQSPEQLGWAASGWVELLGAFFWGLGLGNCGASPGQCEGHQTLTVSLCPLGTRKEPGVTESIRLRGLGLHPNAHLLLPRWPCHLNVLTGQVGTATTLQGL